MADLPISTSVALAVKQTDGTYELVSPEHPLYVVSVGAVDPEPIALAEGSHITVEPGVYPLQVMSGERLPMELTAHFLETASESDTLTIPDGYRIDELFFEVGWLGLISFQSSPDGGTTWYNQMEAGVSIQETPVVECSIPLKTDMSLRVSKKTIRLQSGIVDAVTPQTSAQDVKISLISM